MGKVKELWEEEREKHYDKLLSILVSTELVRTFVNARKLECDWTFKELDKIDAIIFESLEELEDPGPHSPI